MESHDAGLPPEHPLHAHFKELLASGEFHSNALPMGLREHRFLSTDEIFYVLPIELIDALKREKFALDRVERKVAAFCARRPHQVAILHGRPITFPYLEIGQRTRARNRSDLHTEASTKLERADDDAARPTAKALQIARYEAILNTQAYLGRLVTRRRFWAELQDLIALGERSGRFPDHIIDAPGGLDPGTFQPVPEAEAVGAVKAAQAYFSYLRRWSLQRMVTERLPLPMPELDGLTLPLTLQGLADDHAETHFAPAFAARRPRPRQSSSLDPVTAVENAEIHELGHIQTQPPDRLARLFELRHHLHSLADRYPQNRGDVEKLENAFASYFDVSRESIHKDLQELRRSLGDWGSWPTGPMLQH